MTRSIANMQAKVGKKHDAGKAPMHLISYTAMTEIAGALAYGAQKYGEYNYRSGIKYSRIYSAILRHLFAWFAGQDNDPESGLSHLAHAGAGIVMLIDTHHLNPNFDDRWRRLLNEDTDKTQTDRTDETSDHS